MYTLIHRLFKKAGTFKMSRTELQPNSAALSSEGHAFISRFLSPNEKAAGQLFKVPKGRKQMAVPENALDFSILRLNAVCHHTKRRGRGKRDEKARYLVQNRNRDYPSS